MNFEHHLRNIPHVTDEIDVDTYLRAFASLTCAQPDEAVVVEAARDAVKFVAGDAFRRGFETCHANVVEPMKSVSVTREDALEAMRQYGERVRRGIAYHFEDGDEHERGIPTSASVFIDEMALPPFKGILP